MKFFERALTAIILVLLILKLTTSVKEVNLMLFVFLTLLSTFYFALGLFVMNDIAFKALSGGSPFGTISVMRIIGSVGAGVGLSILIIGALFKVLHYEGSLQMLVVGLIALTIVVVVSVIRYIQKRDEFYLRMLYRVGLWCVVGLFSIL